MQILEMRRSEVEGNLKAFFKVQTDDGFVIDGFKLMNGKNGMFASMPSKKIGEKYIETVTAPRDVRDKLGKLALAEYEDLDATKGPNPSRGGATLPPIEDSDLPF